MLFGTWLRSTRVSEREAGVDFNELACYGSKLTPYVQDHLASALQDAELLYAGLPSVLATEEGQREFWESFRSEYIRRIRSVLDHFGAALTAVGCTDHELEFVNPVPEPSGVDDYPSEGCADEENFSSDETVQIPVSTIKDKADA